ncbi:MAG: hypothetical protein IKF71_04595 [Bacilli bacterium]|nr:hypothetical protein [Bacilli bacterium]
MEPIQNNTTSLYTYQSAKKIYFTKTPSKYFLIEKKTTTPTTKVLSLVSRNTVLISRENGILLFPKQA